MKKYLAENAAVSEETMIDIQFRECVKVLFSHVVINNTGREGLKVVKQGQSTQPPIYTKRKANIYVLTSIT